ncbi:MAG: hypothetical protein IJU84_01350, partial [Clostridia bacterium]|nr:hypothetical protein [Clostridia bacterium]
SSVQNYYFNNLILYEDLEDFLLGGSYSIIKKGNDLSLNAGINLFIVEDGTPYVTEHMRSFDAKYVNNESVTFTISDKFIEALNNYSMDKKTFVTVKNGTDAQVILNDMDAYVENNSLNIYVFRAPGGIPARLYK